MAEQIEYDEKYFEREVREEHPLRTFVVFVSAKCTRRTYEK